MYIESTCWCGMQRTSPKCCGIGLKKCIKDTRYGRIFLFYLLWFPKWRLRKLTCFTEKKLENLHLPFLIVLGKSYFLYPKENPKSSHFFSPSEFLFIFPVPNTLMLFFTFKNAHPKLETCSYVFKCLGDPWEITMYLSSGHSQVYVEYGF